MEREKGRDEERERREGRREEEKERGREDKTVSEHDVCV